MGWPVAASQSRAVPSSLPVRTALPSGLNATARTVASMPQGGAEGLAGGRVPEPRRAVRSSPVRTVLPSGLNATRLTPTLVPQGLAEGLAGGRVPEPRRPSSSRRSGRSCRRG